MCHYHSTLSHAAVRADARDRLVRGLRLRDCGQKLPAGRLADLLLLMAGWGLSLCGLFAVLRGLRCCYEAARLALRANLPAHDELLGRLRATLLDAAPARLLRRRRDWDVAVDLHDVPYYGDPGSTPGVRRGQRKGGTDRYFTFATAVLLNHGCRYTVALLPVQSPRPEPVVRAALGQLRQAGLHVRRLLLDRGFYAAAVVRLLQERRVPFVVPVIRRGRLTADGGATGTLAFFRRAREGFFDCRWRRRGKRGGLEVAVRVAVTFARGRGGRRRLVYAYWGLGGVGGLWLVRQYRRRFGIETSYRQMNQGLARTCSKDRRVRLLLAGLALLLRNVWVLLHGELLAQRRGGRRVLRLHRLRLGHLLLWLGLAVAEELGLVLSLDLDPGEPAKVA